MTHFEVLEWVFTVVSIIYAAVLICMLAVMIFGD
jgi:hypothetical protein